MANNNTITSKLIIVTVVTKKYEKFLDTWLSCINKNVNDCFVVLFSNYKIETDINNIVINTPFEDDFRASRFIKTHLFEYPFKYGLNSNKFLYLDLDLYIIRNFELPILNQNQIGMVRSFYRTVGDLLCYNKTHGEGITLNNSHPNYNSGFIYFNSTYDYTILSEIWYNNWYKFQKYDQLSLIQSIDKLNLNILEFDYSFNSHYIDNKTIGFHDYSKKIKNIGFTLEFSK